MTSREGFLTLLLTDYSPLDPKTTVKYRIGDSTYPKSALVSNDFDWEKGRLSFSGRLLESLKLIADRLAGVFPHEASERISSRVLSVIVTIPEGEKKLFRKLIADQRKRFGIKKILKKGSPDGG